MLAQHIFSVIRVENRTHLGVCPISANREVFLRLPRELTACSIVIASINKTDDNAEHLSRLNAVETGIPILMEILHRVGLVLTQHLTIEILMLLIELVETSIGIELVELVDEIVNVNVDPTTIHTTLVANEFHALPINNEIDGKVHRGIIGDAILPP